MTHTRHKRNRFTATLSVSALAITTLAVATLLCAALPAAAQGSATDATAASAPASGASPLPQVDAEVRKIDLRAGKITLKHGDIPNLEMPPMTMVFQVRAETLPAVLKVGDKVRFRADKVGAAYTVIDLEAAP